MRYLLDTDICIFIIRKKPQSVFDKLTKQSIGNVGISSITYSELCYGAFKSHAPEKNLNALEEFISPLEILPFDYTIARTYGLVRSRLERLGKPIGPMDTMIAAHALNLGFTLISNNLKEFNRVEGLKTDNWI